jgi:hypothetical protein
MNAQDTIRRIVTEDSIKQEFEQTLSARAERYLKVKQPLAVPYTEFAPASAECAFLFRDGHYYGCISLSQAVAEAIARFLCHRNGWKPNKSFEKNVGTLKARQFISEAIYNKFLKIWETRNDYHHLNRNIETDRQNLESLAYEKIVLLKELESEVFQVTIVDGAIRPENMKYWGFLRKDSAQEPQKLE